MAASTSGVRQDCFALCVLLQFHTPPAACVLILDAFIGVPFDSTVLHEAPHPRVVIEELDRASSSNSAEQQSSEPAQAQAQAGAAPDQGRDTASDVVSQQESEVASYAG